MDINGYFKFLSLVEPALLPNASVLWLALHLGWAIVLGCAVRLLSGRFAPRYQSALALLVLLWTLVPGELSPAFWLGLAFQSPSVMTVLLCMGWLQQQFRRASVDAALNAAKDARSLQLLMAAGIVLGWVLLLDTLAGFSVSVYAWGFSVAAVAVALALAALFWLQQGSRASVLPLCVLALFVLMRLPSGNLWDALLDPLLWLALQAIWLISVARRWQLARHLPAAPRV